ncbi:uncharacterized protein VTP21DRAFT_11253 [Calcarisporiella thermophila]|uniref:uncharacterized protein n=1 Tax=Calcarisporiella thermophila TaxID=911321 RepID=UPI0037444837
MLRKTSELLRGGLRWMQGIAIATKAGCSMTATQSRQRREASRESLLHRRVKLGPKTEEPSIDSWQIRVRIPDPATNWDGGIETPN